jgi:F-type H+-transporting ATPase subunit b
MSQLFATFGINGWLLLAQVVNFGILLAILWHFLYRPLLRVIDQRREKIAEGVRTAEAAARRLDEAKEEGDKLVGDAARQAEGLVASARTRADERAGEIVKEAQSRADGLMKEAQARADEEKRRMLSESEREIARAAMLAAEKILRQTSA